MPANYRVHFCTRRNVEFPKSSILFAGQAKESALQTLNLSENLISGSKQTHNAGVVNTAAGPVFMLQNTQ